MIAEEVDHRASALPVPEQEPEEERSHPLVGKCRIRGCSGKLRDHTPNDSDGPGMTLKCEKCGFTFLFTPAPSQFSRRERRGRA